MNTLAAPVQGLQEFQSHALISAPSKLKTPALPQCETKKSRGHRLGPILGAVKFTWNKMQHGVNSLNIDSNPALINNISGLQYFTGVDEHGIARGGNLPWLYIKDIYHGHGVSEEDKYKKLRNTLAYLPGNVSFRFNVAPDMQNLDTVKKAFMDSGFIYNAQPTFVYTPVNDGRELLAQLKSDARSKINAAKRDLEIVEMSAADYFAFYKENLAAAGKDSWFNLNLDHALVEEGLKAHLKQTHIIATRRKVTEDNPGPFPIEAAIVLTGGADGFMKLLRITYKREDRNNPTFELHKHAVKFLIFEAMCRAAKEGFKLDTDCFTPGSETLYTRFGVFEMVNRHGFQRTSMQLVVKKLVPLGAKMMKRAQAYAFSRLSCLIYQLLLTHYVFETVQSGLL